MFSLKKKNLTPAAQAGKKIRLVQVDDVQAANRSEKSIRFLALAADENDSAVLIESLYLAKLLKRNHPGAYTAILAHRSHYRFLRKAGVFDRIHFCREPRNSAWKRARRIARLKPDLVFAARPDSKENLAMWLSGVQFKLGSFSNSFWARFLRWFDVSKPADLERLARKDVRISTEGVRLSMPAIPSADLICPKQAYRSGPLSPLGEVSDAPFVFLRFPEQGPRWPLSYLPRLARLCQANGLRVVARLPEMSAEDRAYLDQEAGSMIQLAELTAWQLICVVGQAEAVVGTGGPEKVFASMLRRPVVVLNAAGSAEEAATETEDAAERVIPLKLETAGASLLDRIKTRSLVLHSWSEDETEEARLDSISPELVAETLRESIVGS